MGKKKRKKKTLTLKQMKEKLKELNSNQAKCKKIGFEMLQHFKPKVVDSKKRIERKDKKHKKDWKNEQ